jgi:hypothetical protein
MIVVIINLVYESNEIILYYKIIESNMKSSKLVILVLPLLMIGLPTVFAQSNNTSISNTTGGLSSESVVSAITNSTSSPANLIVNSSSSAEDAQNTTGGLSSESVVSAITNSTSSPANLIVNSSSSAEDAQNTTGGLSSESVTESKY